MTVAYHHSSAAYGNLNVNPTDAIDAYTAALNSADTWVAYQFQCPPAGATPSKVMVYCSAEAGTVTSGMTCEIYSNSSGGLPDSAVDINTGMTADCAASTWLEFTGFDAALTGGAAYWIVVKNTTGTPGTNYPTLRYYKSQIPYVGSYTAGVAECDYAVRQTNDAGTGWASASVRYHSGGWRIEYSDGGVQGLPISAVTNASTGTAVYDAREHGALFTTPANAKMRVVGAIFGCNKTGSPTSKYRLRLYKGDTLVDTTKLIDPVLVATRTSVRAFFATSRELDASTAYRIVLGSDDSGTCDSSNYLRCISQTYQDSAASRLLMPGRGWYQCYLSGTWTDTNTECPMIALLLDQDSGEFGELAGGGGGPLVGGRLVR
jgi:hypothetical protein